MKKLTEKQASAKDNAHFRAGTIVSYANKIHMALLTEDFDLARLRLKELEDDTAMLRDHLSKLPK